MTKPVAAVWYGVEPCEGNVLRVREAHIDPYLSGDIWLVRGRDGDLIADTGTGMVSPQPVIEAITGRPVLAIALCHFYDHAGGLHTFENRACHPLEAEAIAQASDKIEVYVDQAMMTALPREGFAIGDYALTPTTPTRLLDDGEIVDLGDRRLEVLHLPGISPGAIGLWEAASGSLFSSDTLFADPLKRDFALHDRAALVESLKRIRALPVRRAFGGHYGRIERLAARDLIDSEIARHAA